MNFCELLYSCGKYCYLLNTNRSIKRSCTFGKTFTLLYTISVSLFMWTPKYSQKKTDLCTFLYLFVFLYFTSVRSIFSFYFEYKMIQECVNNFIAFCYTFEGLILEPRKRTLEWKKDYQCEEI